MNKELMNNKIMYISILMILLATHTLYKQPIISACLVNLKIIIPSLHGTHTQVHTHIYTYTHKHTYSHTNIHM